MTVENNVAHGFLERKLAVIWNGEEEEKGFDEPKQNKMLNRKKNKKIKVK